VALDFPASPTVGQSFTAAGVTWVWDGTKWAASGLSVAYLPLAGGTMSGPIVLAADPAANLQAATKQYVDGARLGDNLIINGNFAINQRAYASGTALAAAAYGHDRWKAGAGGCTYTFGQLAPDTTPNITAGTLTQIIEAGMLSSVNVPYTLSWAGGAQGRVAGGTYGPSPLAIPSITLGQNLTVEFNTGTLSRVKLEQGTVATLYNRQSLAKSLADCQRYYQLGTIQSYFYQTAGQTVGASAPLNGSMRATPTLVPTFSVANVTGATMSVIGGTSVNIYGTATAAGTVQLQATFTANAEL
jgi:hypothetical protein